jgi:hypothetical protein
MFGDALAVSGAIDPTATIGARAARANARDGTEGTKLDIPRLDDFRDEESARRFTRANRWLSVDLLAFPVCGRSAVRRRARTKAKEVDEGRKTTDGWMQSAIEVVTEREEGGDERENDD